ncbi:ATP-binding cassette domain-containing protein [Streptomyces sp. NPDC052052]|uniref:ATP-binding cassette domain-containing protein n=1 Tax=Streptomyces sp. NPDC052052 TaxID=3154756 RepID=UPI0034448C5F
MLQAIGLTSARRRGLPAVVDDLTFEAPPGCVTALLGVCGSGKTAALRLMLELDAGLGVTHFRGRPLHRIPHPAREVGVLLGGAPGHPDRTVRGQLRMLCAAAGVPASRADELLETVGLACLRDRPIGALPPGMDRLLALASAMLGDPHTLVFDDPAEGLPSCEGGRVHGLLRAHAAQGGTVLYTTTDPHEAARTADRVVTLDKGRMVADQDVGAFSRTRLRPRVAVRTPHAARLAAIVGREARAARRSVEVVAETNGRLSVYGSTCAEIGDTAFRHGLPVHRLADEVGDTRPAEPVESPDPAVSVVGGSKDPSDPRTTTQASGPEPPPIRRRAPRSPVHPLRYELRRFFGVRTTAVITAVVLVVSVGLSVLLTCFGHAELPKVLVAWPSPLPLPPAAAGAGLLGALSFGDEFRYPALAACHGSVPRRPGLLLAKLAVSAGVALMLALVVVLTSAGVLGLVHGGEMIRTPPNPLHLAASWAGVTVGCAWAGLLAAGVFRAAAAGVAAVLAVPVLVVPVVRSLLAGSPSRPVAGLPAGLRGLVRPGWPDEADPWVTGAVRLLVHPVGAALALSLSALTCAYLFTSLRSKVRW